MKLFLLSAFCFMWLIAAHAQSEKFKPAKDWGKAGSRPYNYDMGLDENGGMDGGKAATIQSNKKKTDGFGTLMQNFSPKEYRGKRIRMSGYMRSEGVSDWAGFWLRIDCPGKTEQCEFDNMNDRAVSGNTDWKRYEIVLNVSPNATNIAFGALLSGTGKIWFDKISFEVVPDSVPSTDINGTKQPRNLDFEQ